MRTTRPIVRSDGDHIHVTFDGGRSWLVLDAEGDVGRQFRPPPLKANTVLSGRCCPHSCQADFW